MFYVTRLCARKANLYFNNINPCVNPGLEQVRKISSTSVVQKKDVDPGIVLKEKEWQLEFHQIKPDSRFRMYDKLPVKVKLIEGKKYAWCACGFSRTQPLCDGTHSNPHMKITIRPLVFKAPVTKEVWLCNCKISKNRPFCDGSHRSEEVQKAFEPPPPPPTHH